MLRHRVMLSVFLCCLSWQSNAAIFSEIYVFGDSLSDTKNRNADGPLWIEYLAPNISHGYNQNTNYAKTGATSGQITAQVGNYLRNQTTDPDALYVVWGGADDFIQTRANTDLSTIATLLPTVIGNLQNTVDDLTQAGAKHILIANMPNLGLTPAARSLGLEALAEDASILFNEHLAQTFSAYNVMSMDIFGLLQEVVQDPAEFGFNNVLDGCIFDRSVLNCDQHLFYDIGHPTSRAHQLIAESMLAIVVPIPTSVLLLLSGFASLVCLRIRKTLLIAH